MGSHRVHGGWHPPCCRERSRHKSEQRPRHLYRTRDKSCSLPLHVLCFYGGPISGYAAFLKSPICASNARLKASREVQRSTYAARRLSLVTMSVCFRIRSTVVIIKSPAVKRSPSR